MRASAQALSSVKAALTFQSGGACAATSADHAPTAESTSIEGARPAIATVPVHVQLGRSSSPAKRASHLETLLKTHIL